MKTLRDTENAVVIRTDFSAASAWNAIVQGVKSPYDPIFCLNMMFLDDAQYDGASKQQILLLLPVPYRHSFIVIADRTSMILPDHPLLVVDLVHEPGRQFRATPDVISAIENNLSECNMDFAEYADSVEDDGVFRGFEKRSSASDSLPSSSSKTPHKLSAADSSSPLGGLSLVPVTDSTFKDKVVKAPNPVLVYFWATWVGPCSDIGPTLNDLAIKHQRAKLKFFKLNIDESPNTVKEFRIFSFPSICIFKSGQVLESLATPSKAQLENMIRKYC